jgi:hypothetical protein
MIAVVVAARGPHAAEALRAAVGLGLRGEAVAVVRAVPIDDADPGVLRCLGALTALGHAVDAPQAVLASARVVEVWTDGQTGPIASPVPSPAQRAAWLPRAALDQLGADAVLDGIFAANWVAPW